MGRDIDSVSFSKSASEISIHAPRVGRDLSQLVNNTVKVSFQSTRPVWGATYEYCVQNVRAIISIHAPRVGRDPNRRPRRLDDGGISIHAPRVGRDGGELLMAKKLYISIHAPRVGRDAIGIQAARIEAISIHAPRVGRDLRAGPDPRAARDFNPRAPCGARLFSSPIITQPHSISIHAPRVGRDGKFDDFTPSNLHKRYKRVLARPKNTREKGKIKQKRAYIHAFSAFLGCEGSGTFCALVLRTQYH